MDAVIYNGYSAAADDDEARCSMTVERRPIPEIEHERDVIVKGARRAPLSACCTQHD
jgi:hypothetical protein